MIPLLLLLCASTIAADTVASNDPVVRIAFGSCSRQDRPQPLWQPIIDTQPDVWIWTGDIVYGDTEDMDELRAKYDLLKRHPGYTRLRNLCPILGIYDDHDYGLNNGGKEFGPRAQSQQALLDFLDEPADSPRRQRAGAYTSTDLGEPGQQVRIILLDTRYHREAPGDSADVLGAQQWDWLAGQLTRSPAQIHVIVSSIQVVPDGHPYEKWSNFPQSRARLLTLVQESGASGVLFISGDRHLAEISRWDGDDDATPLFDVTSSGMTHSYTSYSGEPNRWRVGSPFTSLNFGTLDIDWNTEPIVVDMQIRNASGAIVRADRMYVPR